jgi:broad specificity phosphatase PhoE
MRMPGGESKKEALLRAKNVISAFVNSNSFSRIGVSTHGGILRYLSHDCMNAPTDPIAIPNCAVYSIELTLNPLRWKFCGTI